MINTSEIIQKLETITNKTDLEDRYQAYLGKKGVIPQSFAKMGELSPEEKKEFGKFISEAKNALESVYQEKLNELSLSEINETLEKEIIDSSIAAPLSEKGHFSLLAKTRRELEEIAQSMGFIVTYGTDMVSKFENFEAVNIPITHPATEMHDTFYVKAKDQRNENFVLKTHTSAAQNYVIRKYGVPIKAVLPGRCYRFDAMDATHDTMFYQFEGVYIDQNISIADFKNIITTLLSAVLKKEVEIRMRPAFFPFVEPGFEIDARYSYIDPKTGEKKLSKWMEILGAGMVHPNVLREAGVMPEEGRSGFAFGMGINRLTAVRYGLKDIRYFTNGDLRFAKSFK